MRALIQVIKRFSSDERGTLVADVAKAAIAITFLSVVAANVLSNRIDASEKNAMAAISSEVARGRSVDTSVTGSLARGINDTKLDPCALPPKR